MKLKTSTFLLFLLVFNLNIKANNIKVNTNKELSEAIKNVKAGDTITLANKTWTDVKINFYANGTSANPITLKAETPGKVILNGNSRIIIYGTYLHVDGLWFKEGNTINKPVITFRKSTTEVAKFCRVTNCAISNYNPEDRASKYNWVELGGNNNRVDHNSFFGKTNQGPVLVVVLKDSEESINNNHRIDNNYFGFRPALGSNGGETIRIGTSHVSMESSKTIVEQNLFEHCNGEVEIISNKTCDNIIRNNLFIESEGVLTLRHGNRCLVEGNVFFGNNKPNTGGIRVINEGHIIQNNLMIGLKGDGFRAPLVIMNGVPNGPANRYNPVKDVVVQNNTFINCSPIELCEGSDKERSAVPTSTIIANNLFYNNEKINLLTISDDISGISFSGNKIQGGIQVNQKGFDKVNLKWENLESYPIPTLDSDALLKAITTIRSNRTDLTGAVRTKVRAGAIIPGNKKLPIALTINPGVSWSLKKPSPTTIEQEYKIVSVKPGENTLSNAVKKARNYTTLQLSEGEYTITKAMRVDASIRIEGAGRDKTILKISKNIQKSPGYFFKINEGNSFVLKGLQIDASDDIEMRYGIISQNTPTSKSYKFKMDDVFIHGLTSTSSSAFKAYKGTFADTIQILNSRIENVFRGLNLSYEKDNVGKYNAEVIDIKNTIFKDIDQFAVNYYRGGNDESTLGGQLNIDHSIFYNVYNDEKGRVLRTNGIVKININNSVFAESNYSPYSAILKGVNNKGSNNVVFNAGEIKASSKAKSNNTINTNPNWIDTKTFQLKESSKLKNAATDGKDIGIIQ